jgi:hypothetical protein
VTVWAIVVDDESDKRLETRKAPKAGLLEGELPTRQCEDKKLFK